MNIVRTLTTFGIALFLILGCTTIPIIAVTESNKDSSYDGRWRGVITNTPPVQQSIGNVAYMNCFDLTGRAVGTFSVADGQIAYKYRGNYIKTYVNSKGGFKLVIPIEAGGFSGGNRIFTAKKDTLTISGSFGSGKGYHKIETSDFGGAGCTSAVSYKKT